MKRTMLKRHTFSIVLSIVVFAISASAQGTAFNFQGRLNDGANPANGSYDLQFDLFNSITGGAPIAPSAPRPNTTLINGVFSVNLDFGATAFNIPNAVFIEIGVKPGGSSNAYTILGPRQQLTVVPLAVRAMNATNADNATNAQNATNAASALTAANASALNGLGSSNFIHNTTTTQPSTNFNISGSGVINGNLNVAGSNIVGGNVMQNRDKGGVVKAMISVNFDGTILRCYNGITGVSAGNCGFTITHLNEGTYVINSDFPVNDRFILLTAQSANTVNIGTTFLFTGTSQIRIRTYIPDVDFADSFANNPFMIFVY